METTKAILAELVKTVADGYAEALLNLPLKKPIREALTDGYRAGVQAGVRHTVAMLGVTVKDD